MYCSQRKIVKQVYVCCWKLKTKIAYTPYPHSTHLTKTARRKLLRCVEGFKNDEMVSDDMHQISVSSLKHLFPVQPFIVIFLYFQQNPHVFRTLLNVYIWALNLISVQCYIYCNVYDKCQKQLHENESMEYENVVNQQIRLLTKYHFYTASD